MTSYSSSSSAPVSRTTVAHRLPDAIPEVDYEFFQAQLLPPVDSEGDANVLAQNIVRTLTEEHVIIDGRWAAFPIDPWQCTDEEHVVFSPLAFVVKKIISHSQIDHREPTLEYTTQDREGCRPSAYFASVHGTTPCDGRHHWRDVFTPVVFKRKDKRNDLQNNINTICWSMHEIMRRDPRRRFVFGCTIENTQMRVWMMNRAELVVSQPFNFITDHEKFIHFVLSQAYAKPCELGIDTTMTLISVPPAPEKYEIDMPNSVCANGEVEDVIVRTVRLINDDGVQYPLGRGTRVWEVERIVDGKVDETAEGRVLKESWVDEGRLREHEIWKRIVDGLDIEEEKQAAAVILLTPVAAGDVLIEGQTDSTQSLITRGADIPALTEFPLRVSPNHTPSHRAALPLNNVLSTAEGIELSKRTSPLLQKPSAKAAKFKQDRNREHHRLLLKDKCVPLSKVKSLLQVFEALVQTTENLQILHQLCRWVHRDISTGNIMYHPQSLSWKLSDLEFAKSLDDLSPQEAWTGTPQFIAVEAELRVYLYRSRRRELPKQEFKRDDLVASVLRRGVASSSAAEPVSDESDAESDSEDVSQPAHSLFRYNPVHDLESLWWIAVYFVMNKETWPTPADPGSQDMHPPLTDDQRSYASSLFHTCEARIVAMANLIHSPFDAQAMTWPAHLLEICKRLVELRILLRAHYNTIEDADFSPEDPEAIHLELYIEFKNVFTAVVQDLHVQDITIAPIAPDPNEEGMLLAPRREACSARASLSAQMATNDKDKLRPNYLFASPPIPEGAPTSLSRERGSVSGKGKGRAK